LKLRNPLFPLLLNVAPGLGHFYLERFGRAFLYGLGFILSVLLFALSLFSHGGGITFVFFLGAIFIWIISFLDLIVHLIRRNPTSVQDDYTGEAGNLNSNPDAESDKTKIILLSLIPGLPHLQLGLMTRGLTTMILFFGSIAMIFFVSFLTGNGKFLVLLLGIPILWFYSLFDSLQQWNKKLSGQELLDRSFFEDYYENRQAGKRNRTIATLFAIFPGAGHFYLGLQKRGLQLMALFLFSIYILDVLHLSFFLFFVPIIWFYSFFDTLQLISKEGKEPLEDKPVFEIFINYQKWIGVILLALGVYYFSNEFILRLLYEFWPEYPFINSLNYYLHTGVVALILIIGGIVLLFRKKKTPLDIANSEKDATQELS
jgi:hypothetical protein